MAKAEQSPLPFCDLGDLSHTARGLDDHIRQAAQLNLGRVAFLAGDMEAEELARSETGTQRRLDQAHVPEVRRLEDYDFKFQPTLDRAQARRRACTLTRSVYG